MMTARSVVTRWPGRLAALSLACGAALLLAGGVLHGAAHARPRAATFTVTNTNNAGAGSLRQAINAANALPGPDTINFSLSGCPCVILLSNGLPTITDTLEIAGPGATQLAIDGNAAYRVFDINGAPVSLSGLTVQNGSAAGRGAGLRSSGDVTLTHVSFLTNSAASDGGGAAVAGVLRATGGRFQANVSSNTGGALYVGGALTFSETVFFHNGAIGSGGGLFALGSVTGHGGRFEQNESLSGAGGALYTSSALALTGTQFLSNTAHAGGGAVFAYEPAVLNGGLYQNNRSQTSRGGAVFGETALEATGTQFLANTAEDEGGAVFVQGNAALTGVRLEGNESRNEHGGGLYTDYSLTLSDTQFIRNTAGGYGGGAFAGEAVLERGTFEHNAAASEGGGLYTYALALTGTTFLSNTAGSYGGGAYGSYASINGGQFVGNTSGGDAGGLGVGTATLSGTVVSGNSAGDNGGGLFVEGASSIIGAHIADNQAGYQGGGLYTYAPVTVSASLVLDNHAEQGGGLYLDRGRLVNLLLAGNEASQRGSAVAVQTSGALEVLHVTIVGPEVVTGTAVDVLTGTVRITNTIITGHAVGLNRLSGSVSEDYNIFHDNGMDRQGTITSGGHSVSVDPNFADPAAGDYRLAHGSAAIDAATDAGVNFDFEGDARPIADNPDIGFDEARLRVWLPVILQ